MIKVEIVQILISDADVWLVATAVELLVTIVSVLDLFYDGSTVHCLHNVRYIRRRTLCTINKSFGGCSKHCDIHRTDRKEAYQRGNEEKASGPQLGFLRRVAAGKHFAR